MREFLLRSKIGIEDCKDREGSGHLFFMFDLFSGSPGKWGKFCVWFLIFHINVFPRAFRV